MESYIKRGPKVLRLGGIVLALSLASNFLVMSSANSAAISGTIDVSYWGGTARDAKTRQVGDLFMKKYPDVKVNYQNTPDFFQYWTKLNVQAASDSLPCVVQQQVRQLNDYTASKVLLNLSPFIKSGAIEVSDIPAKVLDTGRDFKKNLYMIPYGAAFTTIVVNETALTKAGVEIPKPGYTWLEYQAFLADAAKKLPSTMKASNYLGGITTGYDLFLSYVSSHNSGNGLFTAKGTLNVRKKIVTDYWQTWVNINKDGGTVSMQVQVDEPTAIPNSNIVTGKVASSVIPGNQFASHQAAISAISPGTKLEIIAPPSGPSGSGGLIINSGWSLASSCKNTTAAAAWINFWLNDVEAGKTFNNDNGVTTNSKVAQAIAKTPGLSSESRRFLELYKEISSNPRVVVMKFPTGGYTRLQKDFSTAWEKVAFGKIGISDAANGIFKTFNGW